MQTPAHVSARQSAGTASGYRPRTEEVTGEATGRYPVGTPRDAKSTKRRAGWWRKAATATVSVSLVTLSLMAFTQGSAHASTVAGQLDPGERITSGTQVASPNGMFVLQMQSDGNLVVRAPGNVPLGDTRTEGNPGTIAVMQTDGNFVLRAPGNIPIWASGTDGRPGTVLQVQDDGGVVLYAPGHQVLRVLFPAILDLQDSVATPVPGPPLTTTEPGGDGSDLSDSGYEGTTEVFCAGLGKVSGELVGDAVSASCGILGDSSDTPTDGFEVTRTLACTLAGKVPVVGLGLGPACDILTSDEPAY